MAERGLHVDHATLNRWVVNYASLIAKTAQLRKRPTANSLRTDGTYIKVKGQWMYLYRAVDGDGQTPDFTLSDKRNTASERRFFKVAIFVNGAPDRIVIDKSGANMAGLQAINVMRKFQQNGARTGIVQAKYLNTIFG